MKGRELIREVLKELPPSMRFQYEPKCRERDTRDFTRLWQEVKGEMMARDVEESLERERIYLPKMIKLLQRKGGGHVKPGNRESSPAAPPL